MMRLSNLYFNQRVMRHRKMFSVAPTSIEEEVNDSDHEASNQVAIEPHRSTRICTTPEWYGNPVLDIMLLDNNEPTSYGEAMVGPDSDKWLEAIKSENGSMTLEEILDGRKAIGYGLILKGRQTMMVRITIKKARLVVKIFSDKFKELITVRFSHS